MIAAGLRVVGIAALMLLAACANTPAPSVAKHSAALPPIRHVFVIVLENEPYEVTFSEQSIAPYLAHELPRQGALLTNYYAIGHNSLDNYIAMISGQAPNPDTQGDCPIFRDFVRTQAGLDANGQAIGEGCVYPPDVKTLPDQLEATGFTWKGYTWAPIPRARRRLAAMSPSARGISRIMLRRTINTPTSTIHLYTSIRSSTIPRVVRRTW